MQKNIQEQHFSHFLLCIFNCDHISRCKSFLPALHTTQHPTSHLNKKYMQDAFKMHFHCDLKSTISASGLADAQKELSKHQWRGSCFTQRAARPASATLLLVLISQMWSHPESWLRVSGLLSSTLNCIMHKAWGCGLHDCAQFYRLIPEMTQ